MMNARDLFAWLVVLLAPGTAAAQARPPADPWNHPLPTPIGDSYRLPGVGLAPLAVEAPGIAPWALSVRQPEDPPTAEPVELCGTPCLLYVQPGRFILTANDPVAGHINYTIEVPPSGLHVGLRRPLFGLALGGGLALGLAFVGWLGTLALVALGGPSRTTQAIESGVSSGVLTIGGIVMLAFSGPRAVAM